MRKTKFVSNIKEKKLPKGTKSFFERITNNFDADSYSVAPCRSCNSSYTHIFAVHVLLPGDDDHSGEPVKVLSVSKAGDIQLSADTIPSPTRAREPGVIIERDCEDCGLRTAIIFAFHEGITYKND